MENRKLTNLYKLSSKVAIYVPSTLNVTESVDNSEKVNDTLTFLSKLFGGATKTDAVGSWLCASGELVKERVCVVYAYCNSDQLNASASTVINFCEQLKKDMGQETISLEINNELYFV